MMAQEPPMSFAGILRTEQKDFYQRITKGGVVEKSLQYLSEREAILITFYQWVLID